MSLDCANYQSFLAVSRLRASTKGHRPHAVETGSDRGRIIFSSAFRRLQQKAQVFPLDSNAAVRTRLTHSLEVAHTGRYLAQEIIYRIRTEIGKAYTTTWLSAHEAVLTDIVEAACLIHDIGNPPFGHFGEAAIRDWFRETGKAAFAKFAKSVPMRKPAIEEYLKGPFTDFLAFDGNPQGLRLVTKLQGNDGATGLNLTCALLMAYLKYSCPPMKCRFIDPTAKSKKPGYFHTEADLIERCIAQLGMRPNARHPLSYIMEAADDISYCMSDMEDGIEKRVVSVDDLFVAVRALWQGKRKNNPTLRKNYADMLIAKAKRETVIEPFVSFKTTVINDAVEYAADVYVRDHDEILRGRHKGLMRGEAEIVALLEVVKEFVQGTVFRAEDAENVELAGYSTIRGLLDHFSPLLQLPTGKFRKLVLNEPVKMLDYEKRLVNRLSKKSKKVYANSPRRRLHPAAEWHDRAHLVVDHISGMTDNYAVRTHQLLAGIKIVA